MTDFTKYLPKVSETVKRIEEHYKQAGDSEPARKYLGASIIGHHCERYLWFNFRHANTPDINGRTYRLFETGDCEEPRMVKDLRAIGCEVHETDSSGQQWAFSDFGGHFSGHMDGAGLGIPEAPKTWHVFEFKTHNSKSFSNLITAGVLKSKPQHYAQMQIPMHKTGMKRALYLAKNKEDDKLYSERINYDKVFCEQLMERAKRIIFSSQPPERPYARSDYYLCGWCDAHDICWGTGEVALPVKQISCRQCCYATPTLDGHARWKCSKYSRSLSSQDQDKACGKHLLMPGMLAHSRPVGHGTNTEGNDHIIFTSIAQEGSSWYLGEHKRGFATTELLALRLKDLTNEMIVGTKEAFGGVVTHTCNDILNRYPDEETRVIWQGVQTALVKAWNKQYNENFWDLVPIEISQLPDDRNVAEFENGRLAIVYLNSNAAEIREGVK